VASDGKHIFSLPLQEVINGAKTLDLEMFEIARILSI